MHVRRTRPVWLVLFLAGIVSVSGFAQATSPAPEEPGSGAALLQVSVAGFVVPVGGRIAIELTHDTTGGCLGDSVYVQGWSLRDADGAVLADKTYEQPPEIAEWVGSFALQDQNGEPLPSGDYAIELRTSAGTFAVGVQTVDALPSGRFHVSASVCGISLRVYRLITEQQAGETLDLRVGDQLMVVLQGNPTTGYEWSNTLLYEYAVLRPLAEPEYRPTSMQTGMLGAGGLVLFRYEAVDVGSQAFRFVYQRPWESTDSDRTFSFDVAVR